MSETITIEIETLAKKLLKKDGNPRVSASDDDLETLEVMRLENPDVKLWFDPEPEIAPPVQLSPHEHFEIFWDANPGARRLTTREGKSRSGMASENKRRAKALLKEHGL